jgi:signal-transduction protein with cAMP-binding, CBS, and nucleotidyltransferase domain
MSTMRDVLEMKGYEVYSTTVGTTIDDAVVEMCRVKVGALLVRHDSGRPAGIISERDLLIRVLLAHRDPATTTVGGVMTRRIVCVDMDRTIAGAMRVMTRERCRHLPVMAQGEVAGIVSIGDLALMISGDQQSEIRTLHEYVEGRYPG